jgi:chromosome segregation ATPase
MQQDLEDEKNEATIKDLENKVKNYKAALKEKDSVVQDLEIKDKDHEAALEKKDFIIHSMEGSLAEAQAENNRLNNELLKKSEKSEQEKKNLETSREKFKFARIIEGASGEVLKFRQPMRAAAEGCVSLNWSQL